MFHCNANKLQYILRFLIQERKELERRVDEVIQKQESLISVAGVDSRTKRRCVIMREQMSKKKEWWEEEGLGSESEEDNGRDIGKKLHLICFIVKVYFGCFIYLHVVIHCASIIVNLLTHIFRTKHTLNRLIRLPQRF